jgi:hypothetical protein
MFQKPGLFIFCIALFIGMPVCVDYSLLDPFLTPRIALIFLCLHFAAFINVEKT